MKKQILIIILSLCSGVVFSQQALTLYNMDRVLQSQFVNPAIEVPYKIHVGGLLVPVFGQLPPPMYFNYANNSFHYNNIFHMGTGTKSDSLVLDLDMFMRKLKNTTHIRFDTQFELINVGIQLENIFLTFALTEKFKYGVSLPYDMFEFALNGNMPYMLQNKPHDFSGLGVNFTHYREFAVGGSMKASEELRIGGRVKILFGLGNVNTDFKNLSLYTDPDNYNMTWATDIKIQSSTPVFFDYIIHSTDGRMDSLDFELNQESIDAFLADGEAKAAMSYLMNMKNIGLGFDIGATYTFSPEIDFFASITDFGFITWNTNPQNFVSKGEYDFRGFQLEIWEDDEAMEESMNNFVDTVFNTFKFDLLETGYATWLSTNIYLGGKYKFHKLLHFTALYRGEFYRKSYLQSLTFGVNSNLTYWLSTHLTYSLAHNYAGNIGLGLSARLGFVNWYIVTDNITGMVFPQKMKNLNIRFGCNLVFGYKRIKSSASMTT